MKIVAIAFWFLSALIPILHFGGLISLARKNKRDGTKKGYSFVPFVSLIPGIIATACGWSSFKAWPLLPTAFDPGTWTALYLPWGLWKQFIRPRFQAPPD